MTKDSNKTIRSPHANRSADSIDVYAGQQLRRRRKKLRLTQQDLASILGISFQQVQKYEAGLNRIGVGRLFAICKALHTTPSYFFQKYEKNLPEHELDSDRHIAEILAMPIEGNEEELIRIFHHIQNPQLRDAVINLVQSLSKKR